MFCKYKDIFGKVGEGVHSYRLFNIALFDFLGTIILTWVLHRYILYKYKFEYILLFMFMTGILLHRLFCVQTTINKLIFH